MPAVYPLMVYDVVHEGRRVVTSGGVSACLRVGVFVFAYI